MLSLLLMLLLASALCFVAALGIHLAVKRAEHAKVLYGPASTELSQLDHYRLAFQLVGDQNQLLQPVNPRGGEQDFVIEGGQGASDVLSNLKQQGLIPDEESARNYLIYTGLDTQLQAGEYKLNQAMSPVEMLVTMLDSTPKVVTFTILPGWRLEEVAASLPTSGLAFTPEEFMRVVELRTFPFSFVEKIPENGNLEGYLFPDSYSVPRETGSHELVTMLLQNFDNKVTGEIRRGIRDQGLSLHEGLILASIVEKEGVVPEERPKIASVFLNRLALGMNLETDPTVQYALGYNQDQSTWWTNPLTAENLNVSSLYNTYQHAGLPPGPIANPSLSAIQAVADPVQTAFYYFRAKCDGSGLHNFATTFEEHLGNACE